MSTADKYTMDISIPLGSRQDRFFALERFGKFQEILEPGARWRAVEGDQELASNIVTHSVGCGFNHQCVYMYIMYM
jgi:hypothetical protein